MRFRYHLLFLIFLLLFLTGCVNTLGMRSISTADSLAKIMTPRFIAHGANPVDVSNLTHSMRNSRITSGNWTLKWSELAEKYEKKGIKNLEDNNLENAKFELLKASVYYRIASYPYPIDTAREKAAEKSRELFKQAIKFVSRPPEIVNITSETKRIVGYFRKPNINQKVPLVILLPGIDSTKEEMFWVEEHFLDKGFATFSIDIPGTGESAWRLHDDADRMLEKIVDYLQGDSKIIKEKIALVGFNFGGYWSLRLAARKELNINCLAIVDTPVHYAFKLNHLRHMPRFMANIFKKACGVVDYNTMYQTLSSLSLKEKDLLREIKQPLLVVGSEDNFLVPKEDVLIFAHEFKRPTAVRLIKKGKFGIIENLQADIYPMIADWIELQFER